MNKNDKIQEGQVQLDDRQNYTPLEASMAQETSQKVQEIINNLHEGGHIDTMTKKWLSQTPCLPRIPLFLHINQVSQTNSNWKTYKFGLRRCPTERISSFLDHILRPIAKAQKSYLNGSQRYHKIY